MGPFLVDLPGKSAHQRGINMPLFRVLVVDDNKPFRQRVCSSLERRTDFKVIWQASDGLEAAQKAEELRPDLIVLDLGLPNLNGMDVARRLRKVIPETRILFLSQEFSSDVVLEALNLGVMGYVHKPRIHSDLLPALEAVLEGKQFVSSRLKGWESRESMLDPAPQPHEILFYSDDAVLLDSFTRFIATALRAGNPAIVIATKSHLDGLHQTLKAEGLDVDGAIQQGNYIALDEAHSFSTIMVDGLPVPARFFGSIGGLMEAATKAASAKHPRVSFCGEGIGRLWAQGKTDAAIRLEQLCNELAKKYEIDMLCAYPSSRSDGKEDQASFKRVCEEHSAVHSR
jgi:DNA-binding NarL/FixJ family response regulator